MVFDAHEHAFAFFRGACTRGIYDNMKTAVETISLARRSCDKDGSMNTLSLSVSNPSSANGIRFRTSLRTSVNNFCSRTSNGAHSVQPSRCLDLLRIQTLKDVADRDLGGRTLPVQAEGGVQQETVHPDEGLDGAEGIAAGDHGKH